MSKNNQWPLHSRSSKKHYVVLDHCGPLEIFTGRTPYAARNKAREALVHGTPSSRGEYEEEHGRVSDEDWLKELERCGFTIKDAQMVKKAYGYGE